MALQMLTLFLAAYGWLMHPTASNKLPGCHLTYQNVSLEKEGCLSCSLVETTICSGYCSTEVTFLLWRFPRQTTATMLYWLSSMQYPIFYGFPSEEPQVCMYERVHHQQFELSDCLPGVDPVVKYPVALSCSCAACSILTSNCNEEPMEPTKPDLCAQMPAK
ncbi:lutropin subunit beta isoform X1 [Syngnathus typhle]|uniref:lutropin subunit beta isoform X1 n=1 Tax=Syngnathus typhle TaxID=161592 RepID=UPI002A6989EA|nr:lutropin subunit beta isoform X1 [Syngnathus typhle]